MVVLLITDSVRYSSFRVNITFAYLKKELNTK